MHHDDTKATAAGLTPAQISAAESALKTKQSK